MSDLETRYGLLQVPDDKEDIIGGFLARYGEWAWLEACFIADTLSDNARVMDVGAFVGTFGLGVALRRRLENICFVEANPAVVGYLSANVSRNLSCPFEVVEGMVGAPGAVPHAGHVDMGNLGSVSYAAEHASSVEMPAAECVLTLAELRERHGPFDLIKLDIEGMELDALLGDATTLAQGGTSLWIECNEDHRSLDIGDTLLGWGLHLYYFAFPSFNPGNFNNNPEPLFPMAYEAGLLAAPKYAPRMSDELHQKGCILKTIRSRDDLKDALWRTPRWGRPEWERTNTRPELAAVVCRSLRDEDFASFLEPLATEDAAAPETVWQKLAAAEKGLREAQSLLETERQASQALTRGLQDATELALTRLADIETEREHRDKVEAALREVEALAIARLEEMSAEREHRAKLEASLREVEALAIARLADVTAEREQREKLEAVFREVEALALTRLDEIAAERERREKLEVVFREVEALALSRLAELTAERERREATEVFLQAEREKCRLAEHARGEALRAKVIAEDRAEAAEMDCAAASARGLAHLARLGELRDQEEVFRAASEARIQAVQRERDVAWEKATYLETRLAEAQEHARHAERLADDIRYSTVWRLSAPLRMVVEKIPILHFSLKRCRAMARIIIHGR